MKKFIYLLLIVLFAMPVFAKKVDVETAKNAAKNLYFLRINQVKDVKLSSINLTLAYTEVVNNEPVYYAFNVNENEGFVIISADNIAKPCIGYSFEGPFVTTNQAPSFQYWMGGFRDQIADAVSRKASASIEATQEWTKLLTENPVIVKSKSIQPLLLTTWNQDGYYNDAVEAVTEPGVYVGCVATAMAQVMKYWNYPDVGIGSHTDPNNLNGGYGTLTVNYAAQTYVWENMTNSMFGSNLEIAKLGYHCGVAINMSYSPDGSGAFTNAIPAALESHYNYNTACQYVQKINYGATAWEDLLKAQIDLKRPMVYSGSPLTGAGHAWNCDGYISGTPSSEFHMNWGWGGYENGFFTIANLVAQGTAFTSGNAAVINIYPFENYPEGCTATAKVISGTAGTFNDGSGNTNYLNNKDCLYLIQPSCASVVSLTFDRFNLGTGDVVYIYGGTTISDTLIGTYDASNLPPATISSYAGALLIRFVTDGTNNAEGWYASYNTFPCQGTRIITDLSGTVTDGSLTCDYGTTLACTWNLQPAGVSSFQLTFPEFNFAVGDAGDNLKIYKNAYTSGNLIGTYNAANVPPSPLNIVATKVILKFGTNSALSASGWRVNYTATITGIENNLAEFGACIYPNPFNNDATVTYTLKDPTNVKISVNNILGEQIGSYEQQNVQGTHNLQLSSFVDNISQGIYFVNLSFNDKSTAIKIVCTK